MRGVTWQRLAAAVKNRVRIFPSFFGHFLAQQFLSLTVSQLLTSLAKIKRSQFMNKKQQQPPRGGGMEQVTTTITAHRSPFITCCAAESKSLCSPSLSLSLCMRFERLRGVVVGGTLKVDSLRNYNLRRNRDPWWHHLSGKAVITVSMWSWYFLRSKIESAHK